MFNFSANHLLLISRTEYLLRDILYREGGLLGMVRIPHHPHPGNTLLREYDVECLPASQDRHPGKPFFRLPTILDDHFYFIGSTFSLDTFYLV